MLIYCESETSLKKWKIIISVRYEIERRRCNDRHTNRQTDKQIDRQIDTQTDRQIGTQIDR